MICRDFELPIHRNGGEMMGWKLERVNLSGKDQIKPNEEKDICIILKKEKRAVIHGEVKFPNGKPVEGATVKLFKKKGFKDYCDGCELIPVTFTFTDECGQFLFGVEAEKDYVVMVFYYEPECPYPPKDKADAVEYIEL